MNSVLAFAGIQITEKKKTFTALLCIPLMILTMGWACNVQNVVSKVNTILAEVSPAIQIVVSLLPLLGAKSIPPTLASEVNAWAQTAKNDVADLDAIIMQYKNDMTSPTVQAKINAAIATTERDVTKVLTMIHVLDLATQQKITELVNVIGAGIISVEAIVSALYGSNAKIKTAALTNGNFVKDGDAFKIRFNSVLHLSTNDPVLDAATNKLTLK